MQKGFSTLEIIFAVFIIALLMSAAIPNAVRVVDRVALDYETKKLYSDLRFLQMFNRSSSVNSVGTGKKNLELNTAPYMQFLPATPSRQILLDAATSLREEHFMRNIKSIYFKNNVTMSKITFDATGQSSLSDTLILTSHFDKKSFIVFDSVGRIRGSRTDE